MQPANAWSSLAFCVVALAVVVLSYQHRARRSARDRAVIADVTYSSVFAAALMLIGIGSFAFHSHLTLRTQFADVFGMYLVATFVIIYGLRNSNLRASHVVAFYVALNIVLATILIFAPGARRYVFALTLMAGLYAENRHRKSTNALEDNRFLFLAIGTITVGFIIWVLDITRIVCAPDSVIQGHAIWHILGAISAYLIFLYYMSPSATREPVKP